MEHTNLGVIDSHERQDSSETLSAAEIQKTLSAILLSTPFRSSKQSQVLLQYIVNQTLVGHPEMLKERVIGTSLFSRRPDYDTNNDPIVRARAAEVRKRLALYYQAADDETIRITVPSGAFRAVFERTTKNSAHTVAVQHRELEESQLHGGAVIPPVSLAPTEGELPPSKRRLPKFVPWIVIAVLTTFLAWTAQHYFSTSDDRAFDQFWSPMLAGSKPVLIYIGSNAVYQLTDEYLDEYYKAHPRSENEATALESYIPLEPGSKLDTKDLRAGKDAFVTIGDVAAATTIVSMLAHRDKQFDVRFGNDVAYGDLRESPTILIGAHNNPWTLTMTEKLRYVFDGRMAIIDRTDAKKHWSAKQGFPEDYAIVSRILNSETGTTVITAAGVGMAGTRASAEFLTDPHSIAALVKSLPKDWQRKNIQIVLHTNVINQVPSAPDVVTTYCW